MLSIVLGEKRGVLFIFCIPISLKDHIAERGKLADPFYRLEHQEEDLRKKKEAEPLLVRLQRVSDSRHADDYSLNRSLRARLRVSHHLLIYVFLKKIIGFILF